MPGNNGTVEARLEPQAELQFDERNPRLLEQLRKNGTGISQEDIIRILWREFAVDEVAMSIAANGYFQHEPLFVTRDDDHLVVVEGNRRLAAVRLLLNSNLRRQLGATDLPRITERVRRGLQEIPVIECQRNAVWEYIGFKHVNGPQAWQPVAKAGYIAWVRNTLKVPLDRIAKQIGDQHSTVRRLYRGLMALEQAEVAGVYDREERWRARFALSHLYTGLDYPSIQKFTGISGEASYSKRRPIPKRKIKEFGELCIWLYGSKTKEQPPIVQRQNPDLRNLAEVLGSRDGLAALRKGLPLQISLDISKGDEQLFREALVAAKQSLQDARGRLITGYEGEPDLLDTAEDIRELAVDTHKAMIKVHDSRRKKRRTG
ncbi:MAG: hypothetical protein IH865_00845 [Chloroflexi bacterium]|nr:hypothetical protein [Chloroflexota bacterium]